MTDYPRAVRLAKTTLDESKWHHFSRQVTSAQVRLAKTVLKMNDRIERLKQARP
jgi:glycosylphosphatidylinositol transamidase (GPIT) subunit GPI8